MAAREVALAEPRRAALRRQVPVKPVPRVLPELALLALALPVLVPPGRAQVALPAQVPAEQWAQAQAARPVRAPAVPPEQARVAHLERARAARRSRAASSSRPTASGMASAIS